MKNENTKMSQKYSVLICITIAVILITIASLLYPGGSLHDSSSAGFDWSKNFISNLFAAKAINGLENPSRIWAIIGMAFHAVGYGIFFVNMAKKIVMKHAASVLKFVGIANMLFSFLVVTPLHDAMITLSSTLTLIGLFYITVFVIKSKLHFFKVFCIISLLTFYFTLYLYGAGDWGLLAVMQKVAVLMSMLLILGLEYFTKREDFRHIDTNPSEQNI